MAVKITGADRGTPAEQAGLAGATLLSIDGNEINDMLDYEFFSSGPKLELALVRGAKLEYVCVEKDEYAPLGSWSMKQNMHLLRQECFLSMR